MNYRTVADLHRTITHHLADQARQCDLIVGIPRSGLLAANMLALHVNRPMSDLEGYLAGRQLTAGLSRSSSVKTAAGQRQCRRILVVDDSVRLGTEMTRARKLLAESGLDDEVFFAAAYVEANARQHVDYWCEVCSQPRAFEWNLFHHHILKTSCVDIDGVLCEDPEPNVDDDGEKFLHFLENATPKFIPTTIVGNLVTCRLEKYRSLTEQWLKKQGIQYDKLHMMQYSTADERRAANRHAAYKAEIFQQTSSKLFIESSVHQAEEIAQRTGKAVLCVDLNKMVQPSQTARLAGSVKNSPQNLKAIVMRKLHRWRVALGLPSKSIVTARKARNKDES